uniref:Transformer2 n=1 Tax=Trypoxylus dichotomus TaxID=273928 RepID=A0A499U4F8_TRYDI|nr:transformer2 [Trypoxylus dichotomus]
MNDRDHSPHGRREESPRNHKQKSYSRPVDRAVFRLSISRTPKMLRWLRTNVPE